MEIKENMSLNDCLGENEEFHDATPTWSGFNYQGKTAIYVVLHLINEDQNSWNYQLEFEWLEDFSIMEGEKYRTIHQVKAYNTPTLTRYREAVSNLLKKVVDHEITKAYIHTWKDINNWDDAHIKKIFEDDITILTNQRESYIQVLQETDHLISKIGARVKLNKSEMFVAKQLKDYCRKKCKIKPEDLSTDDLAEFSMTVLNDLEKINNYKNKIADEVQYTETIGKLNKYCYRTGDTYCEIDKLETLIKNEIQIYYQKIGKRTDPDIKYLNLMGMVDRHITERHKNQERKCPILFQDFINELDDKALIKNEGFFIYELKNRLNQIFYKYCAQCQLYPSESKNCTNCRGSIEQLNQLYDSEFLSFCRNVTPHKIVDILGIDNYYDLLPEDGVKNSFIKALSKIKQSPIISKKKMIYENMTEEGRKVFLPTTIRHMYSDPEWEVGSNGEIATNIIKNELCLEDLFEIDSMISADVDIPSIIEARANYFKLRSNTCDEKINEIKDVNIKKVEQVVVILGGEKNAIDN